MKHEPSSKSSALARHEELLEEVSELRGESDLLAMFELPAEPKLAAKIKALDPENQNATRKGWRVVSAKGEINGSRHAAGGPTSPISDERSLPNWKAPSNTHSRGLSTVVAKLEISGEAR
jgi:hypothetical protein